MKYRPHVLSFLSGLSRSASVVLTIVLVSLAVVSTPIDSHAQSGCCTVRGNTDCSQDGNVDISDLTRLIDYLFISFEPLCCSEAGNTDGSIDGIIDISDLTAMIDHLFIGFNPMEPCGAGELSFAQRQAVFNAIDSVSNLIEGEPADSVAIKLAAFLNSLPDIDSAGVIDSLSVWAWFTDGRLISIPNNRSYNGGFAVGSGEQSWYAETEPPSGFVLPERRFPDLSDADLALPTAPKTRHTSGSNFELPSSIQARLISNFAPECFPQSLPIIKALLDNHGYVTQVVPGTVPSLLNVHDDGIFYIDTHGGPGKDRAGNLYLSLWTASAFSNSNENAFAPLLRNDEVVYVFAWDLDPSNNTCGDHWRYGITGKFVAQYMYFVPNSFIFINACEGDSVPSLRNGFMIAGASTYCGFTKTVSFPGSNRMADFMFDRLLGANASTLLPKESPPQRPFDIDPVLQDMTSRGYDTDPTAPHAKLRVQHLQNHMGILAPSIKFLSVDEGYDTLTLAGVFGSNPSSHGRVLIGNNDMPIYSWDSTQIKCFIPNTGAGSSGPVWVEVDGLTGPSSSTKRKSNVVNLSEWRGDMTYKHIQAGTLTGTITVHVHLRADLHPFRELPHETPWNPEVLFMAAQDSYGDGAASGTFTMDYGGGLSTTYNWSGTATMPGVWEQDMDRLDLWGSINPVTKQLVLHLSGNTRPELDEVVTSTFFPGYSQKFYLGINPDLMDDTQASELHITLTNTFDIPPGQRNTSGYSTYDPLNPATYQLKWNLMQTSWPPDTTAGQ